MSILFLYEKMDSDYEPESILILAKRKKHTTSGDVPPRGDEQSPQQLFTPANILPKPQ